MPQAGWKEATWTAGVEDAVRRLPGHMLDREQSRAFGAHLAQANRATVDRMARRGGIAFFRPQAQKAAATGAEARGALAIGALAVGAAAVGGIAIGRLSVGRLAVKQAKFGRVEIEELEVGRLNVHDDARHEA